MPLTDKSPEIHRLIGAFEVEASKFHDVQLSRFFVTQDHASAGRRFGSPNHVIMLWQYYGRIGSEPDTERYLSDVQSSDLKWGVRGAEVSCFALVEGPACDLFVRMAKRAGSLFDSQEALSLNLRVVDEILSAAPAEGRPAKPTAIANDNPLAIWLNYLLYHLSLTNPGRVHAQKIEPDPFCLSLLALERLAADPSIGKCDRSNRSVAGINFHVAVSFPGEKRAYVADVVEVLRKSLGQDAVFYDFDYQSQLARPNLDTLLLDIYRNRSRLVVVFLCAEYARKQWCGLEWRAIRDIIKSRADEQVMLVRFDDVEIDGVLSIDGYIDARSCDPNDLAGFICDRLARLPGTK
jgi:hypothetical protein